MRGLIRTIALGAVLATGTATVGMAQGVNNTGYDRNGPIYGDNAYYGYPGGSYGNSGYNGYYGNTGYNGYYGNTGYNGYYGNTGYNGYNGYNRPYSSGPIEGAAGLVGGALNAAGNIAGSAVNAAGNVAGSVLPPYGNRYDYYGNNSGYGSSYAPGWGPGYGSSYQSGWGSGNGTAYDSGSNRPYNSGYWGR